MSLSVAGSGADHPWRMLVFGVTGSIGHTVARTAQSRNWHVVGISRSDAATDDCGVKRIACDPLVDDLLAALSGEEPFDAVCWAHGANLRDSLTAFDVDDHLELYRANCLLVLVSASALLRGGLLRQGGARLTIVSSIWQDRARQDKLSYTVTKAAVGGIVRSASVDLASEGHLVNGVLPGVLQTPMTQANLSSEQIDLIRAKTPHGRLPDLDTVAETILFLCSSANKSITGQSITVDLGMSNVSLV